LTACLVDCVFFLKGDCLVISEFVVPNDGLLTRVCELKKVLVIWEKSGEAKERFSCIKKDNTPRSVVMYRLDLMKKIGFMNLKILHKNICFGAFWANKIEIFVFCCSSF
jgi:tRNA (cmo5U34)-methyltransferase